MDNLPNFKRRWIVIVNRRPRGPLDYTTMKTLVEQRLVRMNDIACIAPDDASEKTEWMFLWQFPEFDRRRGRTGTGEFGKDRRQLVNPAEVQNRIQEVVKELKPEDVPEDLRNLDLGSLTLTPRGLQPRTNTKIDGTLEIQDDNDDMQEFEHSSAPKWVAAGVVGIGLASWFVSALMNSISLSSKSSDREVRQRKMELPERENAGSDLIPAQSLINRGSVKKKTIVPPSQNRSTAYTPEESAAEPVAARDTKEDRADEREEKPERDDREEKKGREPAELPTEVGESGDAPEPKKPTRAKSNIQDEETGEPDVGEIPPPFSDE